MRWVLAASLGCLGVSCAHTSAITYAAAGGSGSALLLVEERGTETRRQYIVMCHPDRVPVCVRIRPENAASSSNQRLWAASTSYPPRESELTPPANSGLLTFDASPWCVVSIDGTPIGQTPIHNHRLPAGPHAVTCTNPVMRRSQTLTVEIVAGGRIQQRVDLAETAPAAPNTPSPSQPSTTGGRGIQNWPGAGAEQSGSDDEFPEPPAAQ